MLAPCMVLCEPALHVQQTEHLIFNILIPFFTDRQ